VSAELRGMKVWSKLAKNKRRPSEYEIVTTNLQTRHRHRTQAYELSPAPDLAMNQWYLQYVFDSPLQHGDWEEFRDPDQLIYRVYTRIQDGQEDYIDGLLDEHDQIGHDAGLSAGWLDTLERLYTPRRYLQAALQMAAAYVLQIAPASTITTAAGFQEADELRWLSRIAYRTRELANAHPDRGFGRAERRHWEELECWQGIRELMERVLATYDWGENVVALNLVAKPVVDETLRELGNAAKHYGDPLLAMLADNQMRDSERSRRWTGALVQFCSTNPDNQQVIRDWVANWTPLGNRAIEAYCSAIPEGAGRAEATIRRVHEFHRSLGLVA
jgi:toluene monooxygenase system protein E